MNQLDSVTTKDLLANYRAKLNHHIVCKYDGMETDVHLENANIFKKEYLKRDNSDAKQIEKVHKELFDLHTKKSRFDKATLERIFKTIK